MVFGPFSMDVRRKILRKLRALERRIGEQLILAAEVDCIKDIWWRDEIREDARHALDRSIKGAGTLMAVEA